jgi:hypothetical protein
MRAVSSRIVSAGGTSFETPLLIPSFSSRGFSALPHGVKGTKPGSWVHTTTFAPLLDDVLLLSAHDVNFALVDGAEDLQTDAAKSIYGNARLIFIDSGLYESREDSDVYEPLSYAASPSHWTETQFNELVARLTSSGPHIAVVSWDRYEPYPDQISKAQAFFSEHQKFVSVFLLKPEEERAAYDRTALRKHVADLRAFDVIGLTEKELGLSIVDRLVTVARIRADPDEEGVSAPLHIFGALDPIFTPLYFAFGAELFDGLSWLRYGFHEELLVHRSSMPVLNRGVDERLLRAASATQARNLSELLRLRRALVRYAESGGSWDHFAQRDVLSQAYDDAESELSKKGRKA